MITVISINLLTPAFQVMHLPFQNIKYGKTVHIPKRFIAMILLDKRSNIFTIIL